MSQPNVEKLAALLREAQREAPDHVRDTNPYFGHAVAEYLLAHGVTVGPASPVRDPAPPDALSKYATNPAWLDSANQAMQALYGAAAGHPNQDVIERNVKRIQEALRGVRGVRDPSPPDYMTLAQEFNQQPLTFSDGIQLSPAAAVVKFAAWLGVRGSGVVPSAPPDVPFSELVFACRAYIAAREAQLIWQQQHDGGDDPELVHLTRIAYDALVAASPIARGVDQGGVAPAGPWGFIQPVPPKETQWLVMMGTSDSPKLWLNSEAEAIAVRNALNRGSLTAEQP